MTRPDLEAPRVDLAVDAILDQPPSPVPTTPSVQSRALAQLMMNGLRPIGDRLRITRNPALQMVREAFDAVGWTPVPRGTRFRSRRGPRVPLRKRESIALTPGAKRIRLAVNG